MRTVAPRWALLLAVFFVAAAAPATPLLLREQGWTALDVGDQRDLAYALTHAPGECLAERNPQIEVGRALFRSPGLLGGQVARVGISCNACHSDGSINTRFFLPELTNHAGHSDVTSEWASPVRGDGVMNPLPIPDLVGVAGHSAFGKNREPSLRTFVRGVIVEEFEGAPPPEPAFDGMIAYLNALRLRACPSDARAITLNDAADDVRRAVAAAEGADAATANVVLLAAQDAVGRIVERLPARDFARERSTFEALARDLGGVRNAGAEIPAALETMAPAWRAGFDAAVARVARRERRTYFNERTLRRALAQG